MNIFHINNINDLIDQSTEIVTAVDSDGSVLLRGIFDPDQIRKALPEIYNWLNSNQALGTTAASKDDVRKNSLKWSIGGFTGAQKGNARFMLTVYNPLSSADIYGFHSNFRKLIDIRDALRNDGKSTHDNDLEGESFNGCRFQVYPRGGGFMLGHTDYEAESASSINKISLLQLLLFVTERGVDFAEGGAFLENNKQELDIESIARSGDVAVYNGKSFHGVKDIDPFLPLQLTEIRGRVVALVTIYK